jgi:predicted cupin superfamily sugar epimerase
MLTKMQSGEDFAIQTKGGGRVIVPDVVAEPQFNPTAAYAVDAKVWYGAVQYICTTATTEPDEGESNPTPEEDTAHWDALPAEEMAKNSAVEPLLFAQYYPEGNVKSAAEFTSGIKYDNPDTTALTITVKPFCFTGDSANDNSDLSGRVVIPPFVDTRGNPYISDDGTRFKVMGVNGGESIGDSTNLTAIVAPSTVTTIGGNAFANCTNLTSVSIPSATSIGDVAFDSCTSLASVDFGDTPRSSVPSLGEGAFNGVSTDNCTIIVPYTQYDAWIAAENWRDLQQEFVRHPEKADKPATFTTGNLAKFDAQGNPTDSGKKPSDFQTALSSEQIANIAAVPNKASKADATLTERRFTEWACNPATVLYGNPSSPTEIAVAVYKPNGMDVWALSDLGHAAQHSTTFMASRPYDPAATSLTFTISDFIITRTVTATRTALQGYRLGPDEESNPNRDKPLASTADATLTPVYSDTPTFSEWTFSDVSDGITDIQQPVFESLPDREPTWNVGFGYASETRYASIYSSDENVTNLTFVYEDEGLNLHLTATRTRTDVIGYQLGSQSDKPVAAVDPILFAQYYPDGNVKSAAEFTQGIKYDDPDTENRTITVKPFCNTGNPENDNSSLVGRVVIPPFVDAQGNPYISDDGTRFKVVGVSNGSPDGGPSVGQIAIIAPSTVTTIGNCAFDSCTSLATVSLPAATTIGGYSAFGSCTSLTSVSLPAATTIGNSAFGSCTSLTSVSLPAVTNIEVFAFYNCTRLSSVDFGDTPRQSVPTLGNHAFDGVPASCTIIVPDAQYNDWTAATLPGGADNPWYSLVTAGYKFLKHSEWEYARKYDIPYDRITITTGQLQDHAEQKVTLNAATTTLSLPALTDLTGKVSDFGIDVVNGYEVSGTPTAASFSLAGTIGTDYNLIVPEGEDWSEMSALAAGEMAVYYFTLSAFQINDKPTWEVMKKVVTLVPVPSAP